jgi:hypothetical protein
MNPIDQMLKTLLTEEISLKHEMKYVNGGISNKGIQLDAPVDGKTMFVSVSLYGGGNIKKIPIVLPESIRKLIITKGEVNMDSDPAAGQVDEKMQEFYNNFKEKLAEKIIAILKETDTKIYNAAKQTLKETYKI